MRTCLEMLEILDEYLKNENLSRRQFCSLVNIPNSTISSWKQKNVLPSIEVVAKIAQFMNVSLDWLVNGDETKVFNFNKFELKKLLKIYEVMFNYNYGQEYLMLISLITFFYKKTDGKCIILKEQLKQYFENNLFPVAEDIYCPKMNIFNEEVVDKFYDLLLVLQLLAQYEDELLFNFEYIDKEHGWFYFQKYVFQEEPNEKIKENCFFEIRCFDYGDGYKAHFVYQDKEKGECVSNNPVYYSFDENKICIIQSLTDKSSR